MAWGSPGWMQSTGGGKYAGGMRAQPSTNPPANAPAGWNPIGNQTTLPGGMSYQDQGGYAGFVPGQGWDYGTTKPGTQSGWSGWYPTLSAAMASMGAVNGPPATQQAQPGAPSLTSQLAQPQYLADPATIQAASAQFSPYSAASAQFSPYSAASAQFNPYSAASAQYDPFSAAGIDLNSLLGQWQGASTSNAPTSLSPGLLGSLGPGATIQELLAGFAPQAANATQNLNQTLADFGVQGGGAVNAMTQLQAQLGAAIAPSIASAIQSSQANELQGGEFNVSSGLQQALQNAGLLSQNALAHNQEVASTMGQNAQFQQQASSQNAASALQAALANAAAQNQAGQFNAQGGLQASLANQAAQNQAGQFNAQSGLQASMANQAAQNQAGQFNSQNALQAALANAQATNAASQFNANNINQTNANNVGIFNNQQATLLNDILNEWYAQLGAFGGINTGAQGAGNQQAIQYGGQVTQNPGFFGSLMQSAPMFAPLFAPKAP